jgi:hypothetical protein
MEHSLKPGEFFERGFLEIVFEPGRKIPLCICPRKKVWNIIFSV